MTQKAKDYWTTRQAAAFLGISTEAMRRKAQLLRAERNSKGYLLWPPENVRRFADVVAGKSLYDPTRGRELETE